jgi:hypothetical protein
MRILQILVVCTALGGCSMQWPEAATLWKEAKVPVATRSADQFVGQNVDALIAQLGPATRSTKIDDDQNSFVWLLSADPAGDTPPNTGDGGLYGDGASPGYVSQGYSPFCWINVVATPAGIVTQANTEESNGTGAPGVTLGTSGSVCARRLRMKSRT